MAYLDRLRVFHGRNGGGLANEVCERLDIEPGKSSTFKFKNTNSFVKIEENVRDMDCFIIHTIGDNVNDDVMEMLIMIDALKRASARRVTAVMPYYYYARSDKKDQPRISIAARLLADLLTAAGVDRIIAKSAFKAQENARARFAPPASGETTTIFSSFKVFM